MVSKLARFALWWAVFLSCLLPLAWLILDGMRGELAPNTIEAVLHRTGDWALRFLLITLALRPLQRLTGRAAWLRWRRMLGLYSFFYACLHGLTWAWLDQQWYLAGMLADVLKRPYITLGFTAVVLLVPLALTSNRLAMRRLGRNWQRLHRLVYVIAILGVIHYLWLVKADWLEPALYGLVLTIMLLMRMPPVVRLLSQQGWGAASRRAASE
jgi:sulfoxide reductase heme-binding subunit YedZ